ncbi:DcaP family trimeric outer membrane transporter [Parabacteroides sp. PF5-9]|uniref:DcaP family trimeric outer membrane transporter n=1 Tax=Parabacteroides sp. PF5-9 TaxID=1742404 RepID=UPI0024762EC0|nr:DcaP family trimeric outer membrane transporter [Parabacteroides sp. PF5-9]MDH6358818.1 hypothetical protein [Parabacteroides sp. PF5-9]
MKRLVLLLLCLASVSFLGAQNKNFTYKFYGFVRGDLFYNSRANVAPVDGNFYMYPMDKVYDAEGKDLNATPNGSFYTFTSRLGMDIAGPNLGTARTSAKLETDFGGFSSSTTMLRIRQAYVALDWERSQFLIGQTWHPMFGSVTPVVLSLSSGAPFQPFNRSPMLRYQYQLNHLKFTGATVWQLQYTSTGPAGATEDYIKNSCIPELFIGADYSSSNGWTVGAGAYMISLKPRTTSVWNDQTYKVEERMTTFSYMAHLKYSGRNFMFAAKSMLASSLDHTAVLGGYGVRSVNDKNGEQEYTAFRHSTSWVNMTYGTLWKVGFFAGYSKNLGTSDQLVATDKLYGKGLNIDQLIMVNPSLSYNLPHWRMGVEYSWSNASYGTNDLSDGKVINTHGVSNHRIVGLLVYSF